ncbi:hypothetical protein EV06_1877 [Prochlorococcus sp. MIT 0602]|nr:hypothetical protein EV06_1877 [Prochlorococcus sp. MIT 0602]
MSGCSGGGQDSSLDPEKQLKQRANSKKNFIANNSIRCGKIFKSAIYRKRDEGGSMFDPAKSIPMTIVYKTKKGKLYMDKLYFKETLYNGVPYTTCRSYKNRDLTGEEKSNITGYAYSPIEIGKTYKWENTKNSTKYQAITKFDEKKRELKVFNKIITSEGEYLTSCTYSTENSCWQLPFFRMGEPVDGFTGYLKVK